MNNPNQHSFEGGTFPPEENRSIEVRRYVVAEATDLAKKAALAANISLRDINPGTVTIENQPNVGYDQPGLSQQTGEAQPTAQAREQV